MKTKIIKIFLIFAVFLAIFSIFRDINVAYAKQGEEEKSVEDGTDEVLEKLDLESLYPKKILHYADEQGGMEQYDFSYHR